MKRNSIVTRMATAFTLLAWPLLAVAVFAAPTAHAQVATPMIATATLMGADGSTVGSATFTETSSGVRVQVNVTGIKGLEGAGDHGIHVHQTGSCIAPDFESAGEHFNPLAKGHGMDNPNGDHAGDLPNITLDANGVGTYDKTSNMFTLSPGDTSVFDTDGSALVIHANPDDYMTDPSGKSGARVACGVLVMSTAATGPTPGMPTTGAGDNGMGQMFAALGAVMTGVGVYFVVANRRKSYQAD